MSRRLPAARTAHLPTVFHKLMQHAVGPVLVPVLVLVLVLVLALVLALSALAPATAQADMRQSGFVVDLCT